MHFAVGPVGRRMLQLRGLSIGELHGRQIEVKADEFQLREDSHQPTRQLGGTDVGSAPSEQALELLTPNPLPITKGPVESHERSAESVLLFVYLLCKA